MIYHTRSEHANHYATDVVDDVNEKQETVQHYTETQIKVKKQLVLKKNIDVNEHKRLANITLRYKFK